MPVRIRPAIVRREKPEAGRRARVQIAQRKPQGKPPNQRYKSVIYILRGESPSVRLPPAIHPWCHLEKRRRR